MLIIDQKRKIMHPVGHIDAVVQHHGKHQTVRLGHADGEERALRLLTVKSQFSRKYFSTSARIRSSPRGWTLDRSRVGGMSYN